MKHWLGLCLLCFSLQLQAADFKPFDAHSRAAIEQAQAGKPFILAFWSLDCTYCADELKTLGELVRQHPQVSLVTVCVDERSAASEAAAMLERAQLPMHERWQFATVDSDRLRYSIDPQWYGELPRSYFYDAAHRVQAISGRPEKVWLNHWLQGIK